MLHYSDRVSMAHSLEVRVPFLDPNVVELAARVPSWLKVHRGTTKYLVKQIARGLIPDEIIDKPKKGFFNHAVGAWLETQLNGQTADYLLEGAPVSSSLLDLDVVRRLVAERRAGSARSGHALYAILMLEVWLASFLPRALASPPTRATAPA